MPWLHQLWVSEDHRLRSGYSAGDKSLAMVRIIFAATCLFITGIHDFSTIGHWPADLYDPPLSIALFFAEFPAPWFFWFITVLLQLLFVALLIGWRTPWVSVAITLLLIVGNSFKYSAGKINHDILFVITPLVMAFAGWGNQVSWDAQRGRQITNRFPGLMTMAFLLAFGMACSAFIKVWAGWLDPDTQAIKAFVIRRLYTFDEVALLSRPALTLGSVLLWEALDYLVVAIEGSVLLFFMWPSKFRWAIVLLIVFHLGSTLVMTIAFALHLPVYLLFLAVGWPSDRTEDAPATRSWTMIMMLGLAVVLLLQMTAGQLNHPSLLKVALAPWIPEVHLWVSLVAWVAALGVFLWVSLVQPLSKK